MDRDSLPVLRQFKGGNAAETSTTTGYQGEFVVSYVRVLAEYRHETASVYAAFPNRIQIGRAVSVSVDFVSEKLRLDGASWRQH